MPKEYRKMVFGENELRAAAVDICLRANIKMPNANLEAIEINADPKAMVVLKFASDDPDNPRTVVLSRDHMAAALIRHCNSHKIPLPRHADKELAPTEDGLALTLKLEWDTAQGDR